MKKIKIIVNYFIKTFLSRIIYYKSNYCWNIITTKIDSYTILLKDFPAVSDERKARVDLGICIEDSLHTFANAG